MKTIGVMAALCAAFFVSGCATVDEPAPAPQSPVVQQGSPSPMPQCGDRDQIVEKLRSKYREDRVAAGVTVLGGLVEVFATDDGDTWTILVSRPGAVTCVVSVGRGWKTIKQVVEGEES